MAILLDIDLKNTDSGWFAENGTWTRKVSFQQGNYTCHIIGSIFYGFYSAEKIRFVSCDKLRLEIAIYVEAVKDMSKSWLLDFVDVDSAKTSFENAVKEIKEKYKYGGSN